MLFTISGFPGRGNTMSPGEIVGLARLAEECGVDRFGVTDFPFHHDCLPLMATCLAETSTLVVESLVTTPYARLPDVTACAWATMAELSGGRAVLGIGGGVEEPSKVWVPPWGNERPSPVRAVRELVEICRAMWRGEEPPTDGRVLRGSGRALDFTVRQTVPVLIAARGPRMLGLAGEIADIAHIGAPFLGPGYIGETIGLVRAGGERAGRSPGEYEIDLTVSFAVSTDPAKARRMVMKGVAGSILWMAGADAFALPDWDRPAEFAVPEDLVRGLAERWRMWSGDPVPADLQEAITDDILDRFAVAGDPARCAARLDELAARFPEVTGFRFKLPPLSGPASHKDFVEMVEGAGEVIQRFRRTASSA